MRRFLIALAVWLAASAAGWGTDAASVTTSRNPLVRVVTISQDRLDRTETALLGETLDRMEQALSFEPDVVCLPEHFSDQRPESLVDGPVTRRLREWAKTHKVYLIFGLIRKEGNHVYNSAVVLGRNGEIVGVYDKVHPTEVEMQNGIMPGDPDVPVFDTEFGRIGIQICFDVNWRETWAQLKHKGARIIFFPSAYPAALDGSALALMNQIFVVTSPASGAASVFDVTGRVLAQSGKYQRWTGTVIPVGKRVFEIDFHREKMQAIQRKYGQHVLVDWIHDNDWITLASLDPNLTVDDLIREFGLLPLDDYRKRTAEANETARKDAGLTP